MKIKFNRNITIDVELEDLYRFFYLYDVVCAQKVVEYWLRDKKMEMSTEKIDTVIMAAEYLHQQSNVSLGDAVLFSLNNQGPDLKDKMDEIIAKDPGTEPIKYKKRFYKGPMEIKNAAVIDYVEDGQVVASRRISLDEAKEAFFEYLMGAFWPFVNAYIKDGTDEERLQVLDIAIKEIINDVFKDKMAILFETIEKYKAGKVSKFVFASEQISTEYTKKFNSNIEEDVEKALQIISDFNLDEKSMHRMKEFFTFKYQTKNLSRLLNRYDGAYFNLLIHSDDVGQSKVFVKTLMRLLGCAKEKTYLVKTSDFSELKAVVQTISKAELVIIHMTDDADSMDYPVNIGELRKFGRGDTVTGFYNVLKESVELFPNITFLLITNEDLYREEIRLDNELYYRLFGHHIQVNLMDVDSAFRICVEHLNQSNFTYTEEFLEKFKEYVYAIYKGADLHSYDFIENLINRLASNYFCKIRDTKILELSPDCIPRYNIIAREPEEILAEMDELIGLDSVKESLRNIYTRNLVTGKAKIENPLHMVFTGNPGTGKTTVAKKMADLLYAMEITESKKLIYTTAKDLLSPFANGSREKTAEIVRSAFGGVLFIDEAYGLLDSNNKATEAISQLLVEMEEHGDQFILIMAGYEKEMRELIDSNPGLSDRFRIKINFPDYTIDELTEIFQGMCRKDGYRLDKGAIEAFQLCMEGQRVQINFANARAVRNLYNFVLDVWSEEAYDKMKNGEDLEKVFYKKHFEAIMPKKNQTALDDIVGLENVKKEIEKFKKQVAFQKYRESLGMEIENEVGKHMLFVGNPGTGKTVIASCIADILYSIGVLKNNKVTKLERKDLVGQYIGHTEQKAEKKLAEGYGGVIFIDEAYSLASGGSNQDSNDYGKHVIEQLLTVMEERKADTVFIFAGYENEMQNFVDSNPGIQSRIGFTFHFHDYSRDELVEMFHRKCMKNHFDITPEALQKAADVIEYFMPQKNFGNGRFVDRLYDQTFIQRAMRGYKKSCNDIIAKDIPSYKVMIETSGGSDYLYDPDSLGIKSKRRTTIHEIGHAITGCKLGMVPEKVSIKSQIGSFGRVTYKAKSGNLTEQDCINQLIMLLAGRNAERVILGMNATGCSSDYARAKQLAKAMVEDYAMGDLGITKPEDFIRKADRKATEIITQNKDFIVSITEELLDGGELTGKEFKQKWKSFYDKKTKTAK